MVDSGELGSETNRGSEGDDLADVRERANEGVVPRGFARTAADNTADRAVPVEQESAEATS